MLGKILFIGRKDTLLYLAHFVEVFVLGKSLHGFRHTAYKIVLLQRIDIRLPEARDHLEVTRIQQTGKAFLVDSHQEFLERKGIELKKIHLPHRKRRASMQGDAK